MKILDYFNKIMITEYSKIKVNLRPECKKNARSDLQEITK